MKRWHLGSLIVLLVSILAACGRADAPVVTKPGSSAVTQPTASAVAQAESMDQPTASAVAQAESTVVQLKLKPGETYRTQMTMDQTIEQLVQGKSELIIVTTEMTIGYTVNHVDADGTMHVDARYEHIVIAQEDSTRPVKYDSANPSANQNVESIAPIYDKLIGQKVPIQLAPSGAANNIEGFDAVVDSMMEAAPESPMHEQFRQTLIGMFEPPLVGNSGSQAFFPDQPSEAGSSWLRKESRPISFFNHSASVIFNVELDTTYTLNERQNGIATIAAKATGSLLPSEITQMMGMLDITMQGDQTGTLSVDEATGWTVRSELQQTFVGTIGFGEPGSDTIAITVPTTMTTLIKTTSKP